MILAAQHEKLLNDRSTGPQIDGAVFTDGVKRDAYPPGRALFFLNTLSNNEKLLLI